MRTTITRRLASSFVLVLTLAALGATAMYAATAPRTAQPRDLRHPAVTPSVYEQPQAAQNEFVPLKDLPRQEQLPAAPLVMGAYAFVWVALLVYVWSLWRRVASVQAELNQLRRQVTGRKQP